MNVNALQLGCSILSKKSYVIIVVNVLKRPAFSPLGGSFVTFNEVCNKPRGNNL